MSVRLARPDLLQFVPYSSARKETAAAGVMLNANESPWPPYAGGEGLNRYPQPQPAALTQRLAQIYAVDEDQLLVGRGSDETIDLLVRGFCRAERDAVLISPPTFGMYRVSAQLQGARLIEVPLRSEQDYAVDAAEIISRAQVEPVKLVFVCSPNNPTGQLANRDDVLRIADALRDRALVVVDEAYVEYARSASYSEALDGRDNLLVLRTLSKAFGLAAARIGCLLGERSIIAFLRGLMAPYPLPQPSVGAALQALDPALDAPRAAQIAATIEQRERLRTALQSHPLVQRIWPSDANFLCVRWNDSAAVARDLADRGIIVRDLSRYPGLDNCLRLSIGSRAENQTLLDALAAIASALAAPEAAEYNG